MNHLVAILAQVDYSMRLKGLSRGFQPTKGEPPEVNKILVFLATVLAMVAAVVIVRAIWRRKTNKRSAQKPTKLFSHVLKHLGVRLPDRILLRIAARNYALEQPALMLFSPELLERYAGRWADAIVVKPLRVHARKRVDALARKVFP